MKVYRLIGIDPGSNGGVCKWEPNKVLNVVKMPKEIKELQVYLSNYKEGTLVLLEKQGLRHSDLNIPGKAFNIQKLVAQFEQIKSLLVFMDIPFILVDPMKWQTELSLRKNFGRNKESDSDRKRRYRDTANRLYPGEFEQTLWSCDATLIMHFGRFALTNRREWVYSVLPSSMHDKLF